MNQNKLISVVGTTASGKSDLGLILAEHYGGEIISADSRQVYRYLDLGTGKVTPEEMSRVHHHLINILDLNEPFSLAQFQSLAYSAADDILSRNKLPFLVGGTGLYSRSVVEGYNLVDVPPDDELRKELAEKSCEELCSILREMGEETIPEDANPRRIIRLIEKRRSGIDSDCKSLPRYNTLQLGLTWDRETLYRRIGERLDARIAAGMIEEVEKVLAMGATADFLEKLGLEYRLTYRYLTGMYSDRQEYRDDLYRHICHFAKRQITWFRKEKNIVWLNSEGDYFLEACKLIDSFID